MTATTRGTILHISRDMARTRALSQILAIPKAPPGAPHDAGNRPIAYRLEGGFNGGSNPSAEHCVSWSFGDRTPTADCIGFVLWASGIDRLQPGYAGSRGEWLNCASLLDDADGGMKFCRPLGKYEEALVGDWLLTRDHIGFVLRPPCDGISDALVVDCSPRHGRATAVNTGYPWSDACRIIRPLCYS